MDTLTLRSAVKQYGTVTALRRLDLSVPDGAFALIIGANGSGKTTLLRLVAGLCRPTTGIVQVRGVDAASARGDVGFVAHQPMLYDDLTCRENLILFARLHGLGDVEDRADEALEWSFLQPFSGRQSSELSRGLKQRLALARATLHSPSLLLLDEPFTGLDGKSRGAVLDRLGHFTKTGATVLVVTHHFEEMARFVNFLIALGLGGAHHSQPWRPEDEDLPLEERCALLGEESGA